MNDIGLYAELHFVLFINFDKGPCHVLILYHMITTCRRWILSLNLIRNMKEIKINMPADIFCGVIE